MEPLFSFVFCICFGCRRSSATFARDDEVGSGRAPTQSSSTSANDVGNTSKQFKLAEGTVVLAQHRRHSRNASPTKLHSRRRSSAASRRSFDGVNNLQENRGRLYSHSDDETNFPNFQDRRFASNKEQPNPIVCAESTAQQAGMLPETNTNEMLSSYGCSKSSCDNAPSDKGSNNKELNNDKELTHKESIQKRIVASSSSQDNKNNILLSSPDYHPLQNDTSRDTVQHCPIFYDSTRVFDDNSSNRDSGILTADSSKVAQSKTGMPAHFFSPREFQQ